MVKKVKKQPGGVTDKVEDNNSSQGYTELLRALSPVLQRPVLHSSWQGVHHIAKLISSL